MDADKDTVENYHYSLRELRKIANDELPDSVANFLEVHTVRTHIALGSDTYRKQEEAEERQEFRSE
jgi:hypothetical protein